MSDPTGYLCINSSVTKIPLRIRDDRQSYPWTYAELKAQGFPARAFVNKSFDLPYQLTEKDDGIPVFEVHLRLIEGGLLLCIYLHHSISDGTAAHNVVSSFAQLTTCSEIKVDIADIHVDLPEKLHSETDQSSSYTFHSLLSKCPEYHALPSPSGPTQFRMPPIGTLWRDIERTGLIFSIGAPKVDDLKQKLARHNGRIHSTFTCLAALTWAYVTKARLNSSNNLLVSSPKEKITLPEDVRLMISLDWRKRAFVDIMGSSAGNTVALPKTTLSTETVLAACSSDEEISLGSLATITRAIDDLVRSVDDSFVLLRTMLFRKSPDPRLIGVDADPRDPRDFYFNSWRHFGGHTRWQIPGVVEDNDAGGFMPDAIRRAQADWNMGAGLILPVRKGCTGSEILVTLDAEAMGQLRGDTNWMRWVDQVLE